MEAENVVTQRSVAGKTRAAVILGNDALVAARTCTSDQLVSGCRAAGFDIVVPATWGDELVADGYLDQLAHRGERSTAACACPRVRSLVAQLPADQAPPCVALAAPPVAAARYLRALHGDDLLITYVGDCPSATDPSIDACFSPSGFLASLQRQGISVSEQAVSQTHRDSATWERHLSTPGGLPALRFLGRAPVDRVVRELDLTTMARGIPAGRANVVIDLATAAGCVCSAQRDAIEEREPPRSALPVIAPAPGLDLGPQASPRPERRHALRGRRGQELSQRAPSTPGPTTSSASEPTRDSSEPIVASAKHGAPHTVAREAGAISIAAAPGRARRRSRGRSVALVTLPIAILGAVSALGIAAYSTAASARAGGAHVPSAPTQPTDSLIPGAASLGDLAAPAQADSDSAQRDTVGAMPVGTPDSSSSSRAVVVPPDSSVRTDSLAKQPSRRPRRPPAEVIPGWMPQGQGAWTPDSNVVRKRDSTVSKPRPDTIPPA